MALHRGTGQLRRRPQRYAEAGPVTEGLTSRKGAVPTWSRPLTWALLLQAVTRDCPTTSQAPEMWFLLQMPAVMRMGATSILGVVGKSP